MTSTVGRRAVLHVGLGVALTAMTRPTLAVEAPIDLTWDDLVPRGSGVAYEAMRQLGIVEHGEMTTPFDQELAAAVTTEYNGKTVRLPGFAVPLEYSSDGVRMFLLVPYVGACIHVPPPPPNQIVFVTSDEPHEFGDMFDAVYVTGTLSTMAVSTELAEIGYQLTAEDIVPYE